MSADIDMSNDRANIAFTGSRNDIWHRLGQEMKPDMSINDWAKAAGLDWTAQKIEAFGVTPDNAKFAVPDRYFVQRNDTGAILGGNTVSGIYQIVQPREVLEWFFRYITVNNLFKMDVAGALNGGATIWATATYNGDLTVAGERHIARLLMSTTFDGSGATINQGTVVRTVCANTLAAAHGDKRAVVRTRHNTTFNAAQVGRELATIAKGFETFKAMGDAMAQTEMAKEQVSLFFKEILDIPFEAKSFDVSTRKQNQFADLSRAYRQSIAEGAESGTVWAALQAVTRYVDHDRPASKATDEQILASTQFGSGAALKNRAVALLMPRIADKVAA